MQKTEATPEITVKILKITAFISRTVAGITAGSKEKSPFDKSQLSSKVILKLNVSFWIHLQRTSTCHSLTGWCRLIPSGPGIITAGYALPWNRAGAGAWSPSLAPEQTPFPSLPALRRAQGWSLPGWCQNAPPPTHTQSLTGYTTCENKTPFARYAAGCFPLACPTAHSKENVVLSWLPGHIRKIRTAKKAPQQLKYSAVPGR